jgi:hypothetical protein
MVKVPDTVGNGIEVVEAGKREKLENYSEVHEK